MFRRGWVATYTTIEIEYALELGYQIEQIYECYHFPSKGPFLRNYMKVLSFLKLKHTISNENDQSVFDELNSKMQFDELSLELTTTNVKKNEMLKNHFKLLMNCALGKFAQKPKRSKTIFVRNQVS